jgi:hypothetical protein
VKCHAKVPDTEVRESGGKRGGEGRRFKGGWSGRSANGMRGRGGRGSAFQIAGCLRGLSGRDENKDEFEGDYDFGTKEWVAIPRFGVGCVLIEFGASGATVNPHWFSGVKLWNCSTWNIVVGRGSVEALRVLTNFSMDPVAGQPDT